MSVPLIILLLLATLTLVVVGAGVLVGEQGRQASLVLAVVQDRDSRFKRLRAGLESRVLRNPSGRRLRWSLDNADLRWPVVDTLVGSLAAILLVSWIGFSIGGPVFTVVVVAGVLLGARSWFRRREEIRLAKFIDQLPDLARLLANAANAGLSLRAALSVAAQESVEPTKGELKRVVEELSLGSSMDDALERMGERLPSRELAVLVNVLVIQARAGGRIVTALRGITEALEIRRDLTREVATLIAGSKATVWAVSFLGAMMVLLVHNAVKGGLRALLANPIGAIIFVVSLGLFLFGIVLIRRVSKVEV